MLPPTSGRSLCLWDGRAARLRNIVSQESRSAFRVRRFPQRAATGNFCRISRFSQAEFCRWISNFGTFFYCPSFLRPVG